MAFKRKGSPYYQVRRRHLAGYGDTGQLSSGVRSKKTAERMETLLEKVAERALVEDRWRKLLDAVRAKELKLPDLAADTRGRLEVLLRSLSDPLLHEAIEQFEQATDVERITQVGLEHLTSYMSPTSRLSDLADGKTVTALCRRAEREGRKRNSVRRTLLRSISMLLRYHLGAGERDRIFAEVHFAGRDDTREVLLRPEEIERLLASCDELGYAEMRVITRMALQTGADRGVLVAGRRAVGTEAPGLRVGQIRIYMETTPSGEANRYSGEVYFNDRKSRSRRRTVPITDTLCRELLALCRNKAPDEQVFSLGYSQIGYRWERVRERAALNHVRFKDLRSQVAIYDERAGVPLTVLKSAMGHQGEAMTQRYQQHRAALSHEQMQAIEHEMFGSTVSRAG